MEERQRLEIGERITALRERSPLTQPGIAERLGIGLRAYQKLEKEGTTRYERCEEIAEIHRDWSSHDPDWAHVSPGWIWDGRERAANPDLMNSLKGAEEAGSLRAIEDQIAALRVELLAGIAEVRGDLADQQSQKQQSARRRAGQNN